MVSVKSFSFRFLLTFLSSSSLFPFVFAIPLIRQQQTDRQIDRHTHTHTHRQTLSHYCRYDPFRLSFTAFLSSLSLFPFSATQIREKEMELFSFSQLDGSIGLSKVFVVTLGNVHQLSVDERQGEGGEREEVENARSLHDEERHHLIIRRLFLPQSFYQRPAAVTEQTEAIHPPVSLSAKRSIKTVCLFRTANQQ